MKMKNKLALLFLTACLLLVGCTAGKESSGNEKTVPLDRIIQSLRTADRAIYESAFPPSFCEQYKAQADDAESQIRLLLETAQKRNVDRCGEDVAVTYTLTEVTERDVSSIEPLVQSKSPDFVYPLPIESVTAAAEITVTAYFSGSYGEESFDNTYLVLCINGNWYLHPQHFLTVLKK